MMLYFLLVTSVPIGRPLCLWPGLGALVVARQHSGISRQCWRGRRRLSSDATRSLAMLDMNKLVMPSEQVSVLTVNTNTTLNHIYTCLLLNALPQAHLNGFSLVCILSCRWTCSNRLNLLAQKLQGRAFGWLLCSNSIWGSSMLIVVQ